MLNWYQHIPLNINPIAFSVGFFYVRWYSLSYILGFATVYALLIYRIKSEPEKVYQIFNSQFSPLRDKLGEKIFNKKSNFKLKTSNLLLDFMIIMVFATLIGGRIGYVLFYNFNHFFIHPLSIISPYDLSGSFVGIFGMSFHGALIGALLGGFIFCKWNKISFFAWSDFVMPAVPAGYLFGRIGNFLNGELFGRATFSAWGMYFPSDSNILRYPSQLLEALLEGFLLFVIMWKIRNNKKYEGKLLALFVIGYSLFRVAAEFFREPDPQPGFIFGIFTMGQVLSLLAIIVCVLCLFKKSKKHAILQKD